MTASDPPEDLETLRAMVADMDKRDAELNGYRDPLWGQQLRAIIAKLEGKA